VVRIEGDDYTLVRKGNEVVKIDPPGKNLGSAEESSPTIAWGKQSTHFHKYENVWWGLRAISLSLVVIA
jgi:hypothetical protein